MPNVEIGNCGFKGDMLVVFTACSAAYKSSKTESALFNIIQNKHIW